jgi:hypothetical protein
MLKKIFLLTSVALAFVVAASADIPIPPCNPCLMSVDTAR